MTAQTSSSEDLAQLTFDMIGVLPSVLIKKGGVVDDLSSILLEREQVLVPEVASQDTFTSTYHVSNTPEFLNQHVLFLFVSAWDQSGNVRTHSDVFPISDIVPLDIQQITFSTSEITLEGFGRTQKLMTLGNLTNGDTIDLSQTTDLVFTSDNQESVVVDSNGILTGILPGTARVAAEYLGFEAFADITVDDTSVLQSLEVTNAPVTIPNIGATYQLQITGKLADSTEVDVTQGTYQTVYSVQNPEIVEISPGGLVTGLSPGETEITVANSFFPIASHTIQATVANGPPTIELRSDRDRVPESSEFLISAENNR